MARLFVAGSPRGSENGRRESRTFPRALIAQFGGLGVNVVLIVARTNTGQPIDEFRREQLVAQTSLRFEHPAMPMASRTGQRAAQEPGVFWGDSEIK